MTTNSEALPKIKACHEIIRAVHDDLLLSFTPLEIYLAIRLETMITRRAITDTKMFTTKEIILLDADWDRIFSESTAGSKGAEK